MRGTTLSLSQSPRNACCDLATRSVSFLRGDAPAPRRGLPQDPICGRCDSRRGNPHPREGLHGTRALSSLHLSLSSSFEVFRGSSTSKIMESSRRRCLRLEKRPLRSQSRVSHHALFTLDVTTLASRNWKTELRCSRKSLTFCFSRTHEVRTRRRRNVCRIQESKSDTRCPRMGTLPARTRIDAALRLAQMESTSSEISTRYRYVPRSLSRVFLRELTVHYDSSSMLTNRMHWMPPRSE